MTQRLSDGVHSTRPDWFTVFTEHYLSSSRGTGKSLNVEVTTPMVSLSATLPTHDGSHMHKWGDGGHPRDKWALRGHDVLANKGKRKKTIR